MTMRVRTRSVWMRVIVLAAVACGFTGSMAADEAIVPGTSVIEGKITSGSKKTPVVGATVLVYHLSTAKIVSSQPTAANGHFEITGLTHGYYDVAVEAQDGLYVGNQVVNAPPNGRAVSHFNLQPTGPGQSPPRDFPGSDQTSSGLATYFEKSFWLKPKGVAIWAAAGAAAIAVGLSAGSDDDPSPTTP